MTQILMPRRKFLTGAVAFLAAPAIVRAASLMPIKVQEPMIDRFFEEQEFLLGWDLYHTGDMSPVIAQVWGKVDADGTFLITKIKHGELPNGQVVAFDGPVELRASAI